MMSKVITWALAASLAAVLLAGTIRREPTEAHVEQRVADEVTAQFERALRSCKQMLGPTADLIRIEGRDDYVCREMPIEPTPAEIMHRYAELAGRRI